MLDAVVMSMMMGDRAKKMSEEPSGLPPQVASGGGKKSPEVKGDYSFTDKLYGGREDAPENKRLHTMDAIINFASDFAGQVNEDKNQLKSITYDKLKKLHGETKARKLINQLTVMGQDPKLKSASFEEKLDYFVNTKYQDKDLSDMMKGLSDQGGRGIMDHWNQQSAYNPARNFNQYNKGDGSSFGSDAVAAINESGVYGNVKNRMK